MKHWKNIIKQTEVVSVSVTTPLIPASLLKIQTRNIPDDDVTAEDNLFTLYCNTAEELIESICNHILRQKTLKLHLSDWPNYCDFCIIPMFDQPMSSVTHIKYYDNDDVQQTLSSSYYETWLSRTPPLIVIKGDQIPTLSLDRTKNIEIQYVAGYTTSIPNTAQLLIAELVAFWYQNREAYGRFPSPSEGGQYRVTTALIDILSNSFL